MQSNRTPSGEPEAGPSRTVPAAASSSDADPGPSTAPEQAQSVRAAHAANAALASSILAEALARHHDSIRMLARSQPATTDDQPPRASNALNTGPAPGPNPGPTGAPASASGTLAQAMRGPGNIPDVVVVQNRPEPEPTETLNPNEDLWLSTSDGRFSSPIVPIIVGTGSEQETFFVHKDILIKNDWFYSALCGGFKEATSQRLVLDEEEPSIFHFVVAYLYEGVYNPIRPVAGMLAQDKDGGKGKNVNHDVPDSDPDSAVGAASDSSAASLRRQRRHERRMGLLRQKRPGQHRAECTCFQCHNRGGNPCWRCSAPSAAAAAAPQAGGATERQRRMMQRHAAIRQRLAQDVGYPIPPPPPEDEIIQNMAVAAGAARNGTTASIRAGNANAVDPSDPIAKNNHIRGEDMRTWLLTYQLNVRVYICANKYLLDGMKSAVSRHTIDMLESAGLDAAVYEILELCETLYAGLSETDPLLRMIFTRVGFMLPELHRRCPKQTKDFMSHNPEIAYHIMVEATSRREKDIIGANIAFNTPAGVANAHQTLGLGVGATGSLRSILPPLDRSWPNTTDVDGAGPPLPPQQRPQQHPPPMPNFAIGRRAF